MTRSVRVLVSLALLGVLAVGSVSATAAGGPKVLDARLVGIPTGGLSLHGIAGGGVPWAIDSGKAKLFADGRLEVEVEGLLLLNGTNPIPNGRAIVTCSSVAWRARRSCRSRRPGTRSWQRGSSCLTPASPRRSSSSASCRMAPSAGSP